MGHYFFNFIFDFCSRNILACWGRALNAEITLSQPLSFLGGTKSICPLYSSGQTSSGGELSAVAGFSKVRVSRGREESCLAHNTECTLIGWRVRPRGRWRSGLMAAPSTPLTGDAPSPERGSSPLIFEFSVWFLHNAHRCERAHCGGQGCVVWGKDVSLDGFVNFITAWGSGFSLILMMFSFICSRPSCLCIHCFLWIRWHCICFYSAEARATFLLLVQSVSSKSLVFVVAGFPYSHCNLGIS